MLPLWFTMLGPLRVWRGEAEVRLGSPQQRATLAVLLAHAGTPVRLDRVIDLLWGDSPPAGAATTVYKHVGALRKLLEPELPPRAAGRWLLGDAGGYRADVGPESLDLLRFRQLAADARQALAHGLPSVETFVAALELWRGGRVSDAGLPHPARGIAVEIDREYALVSEELADTALREDVPAVALPLVQQAAARDRLDESLQARLMLLLAAVGRQAEALTVYQVLVEELGIDPGAELLAARQQVLRRHDNHAPPSPAGRLTPMVRPAELPPDLPAFAGRQAELAHLETTRQGLATDAVGLWVIDGLAGVGKSALGVRWAHLLADEFPDGQLYVDLRGSDPNGTPVSTGQALGRFLAALGVTSARIPAGTAERATLYRSVLAGRRVLIVLDNATDVAQVRPLLPGTAGATAIVTTRDQFGGLVVTHAAHVLSLRALSAADARDALCRRLPADRIAAEETAVTEILGWCAGLPLALSLVAARAVGNPRLPLASIAAGLRDPATRLDMLTCCGIAADIRAAFGQSYRQLRPAAAGLFRLLSTVPGPAMTLAMAASLTGLSRAGAGPLLAELCRTHLLRCNRNGHYVWHDLVHGFAAELCAKDPEERRRAARDRLAAYYLHSCLRARGVLSPRSVATTRPPSEVTPEEFTDPGRAADWLRTNGAPRDVG